MRAAHNSETVNLIHLNSKGLDTTVLGFIDAICQPVTYHFLSHLKHAGISKNVALSTRNIMCSGPGCMFNISYQSIVAREKEATFQTLKTLILT